MKVSCACPRLFLLGFVPSRAREKEKQVQAVNLDLYILLKNRIPECERLS